MLLVENSTIQSRFIPHTALLTLQSLAMFIRKRDPRYVKEIIDEAKMQASLLAASQSQAARAKASFQQNLEGFQAQGWMEVEDLEDDEESDESVVEEEFECIACKKVYKNERYACTESF
jgi:DnaJ homolog subfamily A member 5